MAAQRSLTANASGFMRDRLQRMFPWAYGSSTKHDYGKDYGWPEQLDFDRFYRMYCRSGLASAAVDKTISKTWQTMPALWESEEPAESAAEEKIRRHFAKRNIWRAFMDADRRSMVGEYAGAIILLRDGKKLDEPVDRVARGIENVVGIIPAWQGQLTVAEWDNDQLSETYGEPLWFQFDEQAVGDPQNAKKSQVRVHRDRMLIWSDDGTLNCRSALEPGYNDVADAEKIKGAGGEGFWKSARGAPVVETKEGTTLKDIMIGMGVTTQEEARDNLNQKAADFQAGFDNFLMLGGFTAKPMTITLPQPKEFWEPCVQSFAASMSIPFKILVGNITGERASTEDATEWAQTNMSRRENRVLPILNEFIDRLVAWGVLEERDWSIGWDSLLEDSPDDRLNRAKIMAEINHPAHPISAEPAFLPDEIREAAGFKPADEVEGFDEFLREREERKRQAAEDGPVETVPDDEATE